MTCEICGKKPLTGFDLGGQPGTYLIDSSCHDGVWMDDDKYAEGWEPDTVYPPCPNNPACCKSCGGTDNATPEDARFFQQDDCPRCESGWIGGPQWPEVRGLDVFECKNGLEVELRGNSASFTLHDDGQWSVSVNGENGDSSFIVDAVDDSLKAMTFVRDWMNKHIERALKIKIGRAE